MAKQIQLTGKYGHLTMIVDEEDYKEVSGHIWRGHIGNNGVIYAKTRIKNPGFPCFWLYAHRMIADAHGTDLQVDHKNHNGLDNRRRNLRLCTNGQNQHNRKKTRGTSKFKGVYWDRQRSRWKARIRFSGKEKCLGLFRLEEEAAKAYNEAARIHHKKFARPNRV